MTSLTSASQAEMSVPDSNVRTPEPSGLDRAAIDRVASELARRLDLPPSADLETVVHRLGGRVRAVDRGARDMGSQDRHASLRVEGQRDFEIRVPDDVGTYRHRYLLAHEIGHLALHYPLVAPAVMEAYYVDSTQAEWEANAFAAAFLMPAGSFTTAFEASHGVLGKVADVFQVSRTMAEQRARWLGLVVEP